MSAHRSTRTIECDQCGREWFFGDIRLRVARKFAGVAGWDIGRGSIGDLCPPCVELPAVTR